MAMASLRRACALVLVALACSSLTRQAAAGAPSHCATTGTPLQAPVVGGGSFGFSVSASSSADTIVVGQPDAQSGAGLAYAYNQVALCAYQSYMLPAPAASAGGDAPAALGMMSALSRDGRWLAIAGTVEASGTSAQVFVYRRQSNDSTGGFVFHQKLPLQPAPTSDAGTPPGKVYAGSLSISRDGRLVLASWSVYGPGLDATASDPYGAPATSAFGSAQLFRRGLDNRYTRAQANLARLAPALAQTQFFGSNSYVVADGTIIAVSTRVVDANQPATGAPGVAVYQRLTTGAFAYVATLKAPDSDGTFAMTESGSHLAVVRGSDVYIYVREGNLVTGKFVYNKRCTLAGGDMNLQANYTKLAMTISNNSTLRLAISNSLDTVFVWSVPLGGARAYSDGTCPGSLDATLTGDSNTQFGAAMALSESGKTLVIGVPGTSDAPEASVLVADISPAAVSASPPASVSASSASGLAGLFYNPKASAAVFDNSYFVTNPSTVLVSARRGTVGVPAPQTFSLSSWAQGSPGGAPYSASSGYAISPTDPYISGGTPVQNSIVSVTSALRGLGLTTAALRSALSSVAGSRASTATSAYG